jgi:hypothetical protein
MGELVVMAQPSASRTSVPRVPFPSSKLLGYYHSSALRTELLGQSPPTSYPKDQSYANKKGRPGKDALQTSENFGGAEGDRTPDLLNAIQALSQLSYGPLSGFGQMADVSASNDRGELCLIQFRSNREQWSSLKPDRSH